MTNTTFPEILNPDDLALPDFLKSENRPPPPAVRRSRKPKYVMPKPEKIGKKRKKREREDLIERAVLSAIDCGAHTWKKMRPLIQDDVEDNEIRNARKRMKKRRLIYQQGRRFYRNK